MGQCVWVNGKLVEREAVTLSIYDHGFLYGDGAFEGIRVYNRRVFRLQEHIDRLYRSARALAIELGVTNREFFDAVVETARANNVESGYIRVSISRGVGLGLDPASVKTAATIIISTEQLTLSAGDVRQWPQCDHCLDARPAVRLYRSSDKIAWSICE